MYTTEETNNKFNEFRFYDPFVRSCCILYERGDIAYEEMLRLCIVYLVEDRKRLQNELIKAVSKIPVSKIPCK